MTHSLRGLYVITDQSLGDNLLSAVEAALQGGAAIVQYRDKSTDHVRRESEARALLQLCRLYHKPLLINDDMQLAYTVGADGVHLGQTDGELAQARQLLGESAIIGITCHDSLELAEQAVLGGANYIAFGAFFPSATKPQAKPARIDNLALAKARFQKPITAIGGITLDNALPLIQAGADCLAVISDLWNAPDITQRAHAYTELFK